MMSAKDAAKLTSEAREIEERERIQVKVPAMMAKIEAGIRQQAAKGDTYFIADKMYKENKTYLESLGYKVDNTYVCWKHLL